MSEKLQENCLFIQYFEEVQKIFKALQAGLTNQHDILDFFSDTPLACADFHAEDLEESNEKSLSKRMNDMQICR